MQAFEHELAVSAVRYDALLVADILARLKPALGDRIIWTGQDNLESSASILGADARVVLLILHPLWSHEPATAADSGMLKQRMKRRPKSVVVLSVEGAVVPDWLSKAQVHELRTEGLEPVITSIISLVARQGGAVLERVVEPLDETPHLSRFGGEGAPFLDQGRAQNTLRHELQRLFEAIESRMDVDVHDEGTIVEVSSLPNRIIARRGALALSFSWLTGRLGGVSDGNLLVIEWAGITGKERGLAALKSATASREASYHPEANDAASWCWRAGHQHGRACSTIDLVGEWFDGAALTERGVMAQA